MDLDEAKINLYGISSGSIVDGPGIRFAVFMQGCTHRCEECHNQKSQAHGNGVDKSISEIIKEFDEAKSCTGVTLSGGEPFEQSHAVSILAQALKEKNVNVWCYTGYLFEDLLAIAASCEAPGQTKYCNQNNAADVNRLLHNIDVLVDGEFDKNKKSYAALFRGSTNQRLIDVPKSLKNGSIVEWTQEFKVPERPASW